MFRAAVLIVKPGMGQRSETRSLRYANYRLIFRSMGVFFQYELRLALRQASDLMPVLIFFILAATLFPLGVGPEPALLGRIASGVIWVTALLAAMLSLDRLFEADYADGMLEQLVLSPQPLALLVVAKIAVHWLTTGLPLLLLAPLLGAMLNLEASAYGALLAAMALGTPCLSLIGALGAAVTLGARRSGALVPLLVLPLVLPVLIFGVSAVEGAATGLGGGSSLLILGALLAVTLPLAPLLVAMALRLALRD